jgi:NADPH:quinone reductase-like Zn-dependent oxidoreductase
VETEDKAVKNGLCAPGSVGRPGHATRAHHSVGGIPTSESTSWSVIFPLLGSGAVKPIVAKTFPLAEAADALRYLVEGRPFGRVVLTI